jgi:hypothetical protein
VKYKRAGARIASLVSARTAAFTAANRNDGLVANAGDDESPAQSPWRGRRVRRSPTNRPGAPAATLVLNSLFAPGGDAN